VFVTVRRLPVCAPALIMSIRKASAPMMISADLSLPCRLTRFPIIEANSSCHSRPGQKEHRRKTAQLN
jgi:hypothetical protein